MVQDHTCTYENKDDAERTQSNKQQGIRIEYKGNRAQVQLRNKFIQATCKSTNKYTSKETGNICQQRKQQKDQEQQGDTVEKKEQ